MDIIFWIIYMMQVPTMLHIMQQESYQNDGMIRWITKNPKKAFKTSLIGMLLSFIIFVGLTLVELVLKNHNLLNDIETFWVLTFPTLCTMLFLVIYNIVQFVKAHKERKMAKKPLKYTARAKRLYFYNFLVVVILEVLIKTSVDEGSVVIDNLYKSDLYGPLVYAFLIFSIPINMVISNWFVAPVEMAIGTRYIRKAYKKLNKDEYKNLIKIGITGSYGKTSTKFILKTILEEKYNVLATPGSFNTTMGNVRVIREELKPEHQVFISEMGARKKGDIREICDFVKPHVSIITSIGPQHLETFKNIGNVAKTKGEILQGTKNINNPNWNSSPYNTIWQMTKDMLRLKNDDKIDVEDETLRNVLQDGAVFLNKDGAECEELYKKDSHTKKYLFSADKKADVYAKNIKSSPDGSEFTVVSKKYKEYTCQTKLLGVHNVQNIIGAIAIAEYLGLTKEEIQSGVSKIEPVEHRLQLIPSTNGTIVIDDAFNSNPKGSKAALDVIKEFEGRKIIITPGMVELGAEEDKLNKEFGKQMAEVIDFAILVGPKHTKPIQEGLKEKKFDDMNIFVVSNLDEATATLAKITKVGDVILFENDLPDSYNE